MTIAKIFKKRDELDQQLAELVANSLSDSIVNHGSAHMLISPDGVSEFFLEALSTIEVNWKFVVIGLVDDCYVETFSKFSAERFLRTHLLLNKAENARFIGMVHSNNRSSINLEKANEAYQPFKDRLDVAIIGLGNDGRSAGLFPDDDASDTLVESKEIGLFYTEAPESPTTRIACSPQLLLSAKELYLSFTGREKMDVLEYEGEVLPVHFFAKRRKDMQILYAQK